MVRRGLTSVQDTDRILKVSGGSFVIAVWFEFRLAIEDFKINGLFVFYFPLSICSIKYSS